MALQDDTGVRNPLQEVIDEATDLKKAVDDIGAARDAAEAMEQALEYAASGHGDLIECLDLIGEAVGLLAKFAPPGMSDFVSTYSKAVDTAADNLKKIPLTAYDKAIDRAYDETGDPERAAAAADRLLPDTPAADRARGVQRVRLRHLKKRSTYRSGRWYDWSFWPWNWFAFWPGGAVAASALLTVTLVLLATSGSTTAATGSQQVAPTPETPGAALPIAEQPQGRAIAEASPAPDGDDWVSHCDGYVRTRDTDDDGLADEVHVDLNGDGAIDGGEPHYAGAKGVSVVPWNERNPECLIYVDTNADGHIDTLIRMHPTVEGVEHTIEDFPARRAANEDTAPDPVVPGGGDHSPSPSSPEDDASHEESGRSGSGSR